MQRILLVGATSAIAQAAARILAERGDHLYLVARGKERLETVAADLRTRGAGRVETEVLDASDLPACEGVAARAEAALDGLDVVLVAHGTLGDQKASQASFEATQRELTTNFLSVVAILTPAANRFEETRAGTICVISSVAGDRGRQSNYVYGTAKAAVSTYLQGLRNRLHPAGVAVVTVKPGFVDTPMTAHLQKGILFASPEKIGKGIVRAMDKRRDVVYLPWFWRPILFIIRHVPEVAFKRTKL
jgi:short-subunit dehydrogenase